MSDEILSRVQAKCEHEWQYAPGVGRQCHKCALPWDVWAERRLAALEERIAEEFEDGEGDDAIILCVATLLPPQNEYTCPHCNGTGQRAFFDYTIVCPACSMAYDLNDVVELGPDDALPCGHQKRHAAAITDCVPCHGTGINIQIGH